MQQQVVKDIFALISKRNDSQCNFLEGPLEIFFMLPALYPLLPNAISSPTIKFILFFYFLMNFQAAFPAGGKA